MKYSEYQHIRQILFAASVCLLVILVWGNKSPLAAQEPGSQDRMSSVRKQLMERQLAAALDASNSLNVLAFQGVTDLPCQGGLAGPFPCSGVDLLAWLPLNELGATSNPVINIANDVWGWTDPISGAEYAIVGHSSGVTFVDLTTPTTPTVVGFLPPNVPLEFSHLWGDYKVYSNTLYKVNEAAAEGMQVFDLNQLRTAAPGTIFTHTTVYTGFGSAHNIVINEQSGFAYAVGANGDGLDVNCPGSPANSGGLHIIDLTNPLTPTFAGCFNGDGYTHDAQCVIYNGPDPAYVGREICFNANEDTLTIADVTNKLAPTLVSTATYATVGYAHQGWLAEDHRYFLLGDELDEFNGLVPATSTYIWDLIDLDAPLLTGVYMSGASIDHNLYIVAGRDLAYQANYASGLRLVGLSNIAGAGLTGQAFFDTYPAADTADFVGAWGVYPFFESGVIAVSDMQSGLFLLRFNPVRLYLPLILK